ncbi:MAG: PhnD/SsuA/transferrin family substrate-binding protein [Bacteroidota bacterium]
MRTYHKLTMTLLVVIFCFIKMGCKSQVEPLRIATYAYSNNDRINNLRPLSLELEKVLKRPVVISSYSDVLTFIEGMDADEVDIGLINTFGYLLLASENKNMVPVVTLRIKEGAIDNYKTVLLTTCDSITDLDFLRDNAEKYAMMFVAKGSTSGNLMPRLLLSSIDITSPETQFREVSYGGNHMTTLKSLIRGDSDLCAMGSNEYFKQIRADSSLVKSLNPLWISEEIPLGPVLLNDNISPSDKRIITEVFLNLHRTNPLAFDNLKKGWSEAGQAEKFQVISHGYYDAFRTINGNATDLNNILISFDK